MNLKHQYFGTSFAIKYCNYSNCRTFFKWGKEKWNQRWSAIGSLGSTLITLDVSREVWCLRCRNSVVVSCLNKAGILKLSKATAAIQVYIMSTDAFNSLSHRLVWRKTTSPIIQLPKMFWSFIVIIQDEELDFARPLVASGQSDGQ